VVKRIPPVHPSYVLAAVCTVILLIVARPCIVMAVIPLCIWGYLLLRLLTFLLAFLGGLADAMFCCLRAIGGPLLQMLLIWMLLWLWRSSCMPPLVRSSMSWFATILALAWSFPSPTALYEPTLQDLANMALVMLWLVDSLWRKNTTKASRGSSLTCGCPIAL